MITAFHPDWSFIINFVGIFLAILPLILGIKLSFSRELGLIQWSNHTSHEKVPGRNDIVKQIHKIELVFQNHGKEVIYLEDLVGPIEINLGNITSLAKVTFSSNCKYNTVDFSIVDNKIHFSFNFLEYNKYLKVQVDYFSDEKVDATVIGKVIGGNDLDCKIESNDAWNSYFVGKKNVNANLVVFPLVTCGLFITSGFMVSKMFSLSPEMLLPVVKKFDKISYLVIFAGVVLLTICIPIGFRIKNLFVPFAIFAEKEKNWHIKNEYNCDAGLALKVEDF